MMYGYLPFHTHNASEGDAFYNYFYKGDLEGFMETHPTLKNWEE